MSTGDGESSFDSRLLEAKFAVPPTPSGSVSRISLIESARSTGCRIVSVTAPAGYGKSTLLSQWAAAEDRSVGWVSLDQADDDPASLLVVLAASYSLAAPGNDDLLNDMQGLGLGVSVLGRAAPRLTAAFASATQPFVLFVDDFHEVNSSACHDALSVVFAGIPAGSQVVIASRLEQPHVSRLRTSGDVAEIGAQDLALSRDGVEQIFTNAHLHLSAATVDEVTNRTEGWAAGVYLAAKIAQESGTQHAPVSGDDRYVADYLYSEALDLLPEEVQQFLRRTAVLNKLCAPLCEAVVDQPSAQQMLQNLEASSLFVVPLDRTRQWYRYHELFREFLLSELRRVEPEMEKKLQLRAADWFESTGSPSTAIEHLLNTDEYDRCVQLVAQSALPTVQAGQISTVDRWLNTLGAARIEAYPPLAVMAGWIAVYIGQAPEAERIGAFLNSATYDQVPVDGTASFESSTAMLRAIMCVEGPEQMRADAQFAVDQEPTWSPWRDTALVLLGDAMLILGDDVRAHAILKETISAAGHHGNADTLVAAEAVLATLAIEQHHWDEAADRGRRLLAAIDEHRMVDYPSSILGHAVAARLAVHAGNEPLARIHLTRGMRARPTCTYAMPSFAVRARIHLARAHQLIGEIASARHLLLEIDEVIRRRPQLGTLVDEVAALRVGLDGAEQARELGASPLTPAELRLLPYLQTHLTIREIGERLFVSRNTVSSEVSSIYRKLGVSSRSDAVRRATDLGLLGG